MADEVLPLFAYGTLLTGALDPTVRRLVAHHTVRLGPARIHGRLHDQGGYPGLLLGGSGWVHGELLGLADPERALVLLDRYEGFDSARPLAGEYLRVTVSVERLPDGATQPVWTYLLNPSRARPGPRIPCGDWTRRAR